MKKIVLFIVLISGCINTKEFVRKDQHALLRAEIASYNVRREAEEKAERLLQLVKMNNRTEMHLDFIYKTALGNQWLLELIKDLQFENVTRFAETAQVRMDLADLCARLRKHHKIPEDHFCSLKKTKRLESNPKTENEMILEEFNKKIKQIERRKKK